MTGLPTSFKGRVRILPGACKTMTDTLGAVGSISNVPHNSRAHVPGFEELDCRLLYMPTVDELNSKIMVMGHRDRCLSVLGFSYGRKEPLRSPRCASSFRFILEPVVASVAD